MPVVDVPGLGQVEFPEGTPKETMELSIRRSLVERQGQQLKANPQAAMEQELANPSPSLGLTEQQFTQARQAPALAEAQAFNKKALGMAIPVAGMAASLFPGLQGFAAQTAIGAAVPALQQLTGNEPPSMGQIGLGAALPGVLHGAVGAVKGIARKTASALEPGLAREAGVEAANRTMGNAPKSISRVGGEAASKGLFQEASQAGEVPLKGINSTINATWDRLTNMSNAPTRATKYLENLSNKYAGKQSTTYDDLKNELQLMKSNADKAFSQKDPVTGRALYQARSELLNEADKISPALKQANAAYRREQATQEITDTLRKAGPGAKIRQLFETDPLVAGAFSKQEIKEIYDISDQLSAIGATGSPYSGVTAKIFNVVASPFAVAMTTPFGRFLIRQTFKQNGVTPQALSAVAVMGRAMEAQGK